MECNNCGIQLAEGSKFCAQCGAPVIAKNKKDYLQNLAPQKIRNKQKLSKLLAVLCVALMLISYLTVMNTSLEDIPVIEMLSQGDTDVFTDMKDDMEEMADTMEDGMDAQADELEDLLTKNQIRKLEKFAKSVRKCAGTLSVANFNQMINRFEKVAKMDVDEVGDLSDELDDVRQAKTAIAVISGILVVGALGIGAFLFLGGYFHKNVLSILGAIGAFFYCLMGCGILLLLLVMLSVIAMIYMTKGVNSAYKEHLKTK